MPFSFLTTEDNTPPEMQEADFESNIEIEPSTVRFYRTEPWLVVMTALYRPAGMPWQHSKRPFPGVFLRALA